MGQRNLLAVWKECLGISDVANGRGSLDEKKTFQSSHYCYQPSFWKETGKILGLGGLVWQECELSIDVGRGEMRLAMQGQQR